MNRWTMMLAGLLGMMLPVQILADAERPYYGHGMMWDGGWGMMFFGPLMMIVFVGAIVVLVVLVIRWLGGSGHFPAGPAGSPSRTPLDILKERLAKGEIDVAEFEERRRVLGE
jgi:putative membrane protein